MELLFKVNKKVMIFPRKFPQSAAWHSHSDSIPSGEFVCAKGSRSGRGGVVPTLHRLFLRVAELFGLVEKGFLAPGGVDYYKLRTDLELGIYTERNPAPRPPYTGDGGAGFFS